MRITKPDIQDRLRDYPRMHRLFSRSLLERPDGEWSRNRIILMLYRDPGGLKRFENTLSYVYEKAENTDSIKSKLDGKEADFDRKILHVYAEISAARFFISIGFDYVKFLEEKADRSHPDLEIGESGVVHFAEVKYLEVTADELTPVLDWFNELVIEHPEIYDSKRFYIKVYPSSLRRFQHRLRDKKQRDKLVRRIVKNLHNTIQCRVVELENTLSRGEPYAVEITEPFPIRFEIEKYPRFMAFFFHPEIHCKRITLGTEFYHYGPLYAKLIGRIHSGYLQLLSNRDENFDLVRNDFLFLYIEEKAVDVLYKDIDDKLNLILDALETTKFVQIFTNRPLVMKVDREICPLFSNAYNQQLFAAGEAIAFYQL